MRNYPYPERAARLQQMSANQHHRLAAETEEKRAARLQQTSANQHHRLVSETEEERAARLQQMSAYVDIWHTVCFKITAIVFKE